jgi:erythromycin esterase-like protein
MTYTGAVYPTLDDWIAQEASPFSLDSRPDFNAAVDKVINGLGDSIELLGFGEALHGGEELLILRNQLFQRLAESHGYSAIAIESSFPQGRLVNAYVLGGGPASYEAVRDTGITHTFGKIEANRELVEWMRHYNSDPAHPVKLQFYGFDSPTDVTHTDSPRHTLQVALDYLSSVNRAVGQEFRNRIEAVLGEDAEWENPAAIMDPSKAPGRSRAAKALRVETEELIAELLVRRPELVAKSDKAAYQEALMFAVEARQLLHYHAVLAIPSENRQARLLGIRDAIMAENLSYIVSREQGRGKVMAFAHNSHLKRGEVQWQFGDEALIWWPVGSHLNAIFGQGYAVIGSALGDSPANGIGQPEAGTLEARLTAAPGPGRFIPTHHGQGLNAEEITALPVRTGSRKNGSYVEQLSAQSFSDYDGLAVIDTVTYSRGWPPLEEWGAPSGE